MLDCIFINSRSRTNIVDLIALADPNRPGGRENPRAEPDANKASNNMHDKASPTQLEPFLMGAAGRFLIQVHQTGRIPEDKIGALDGQFAQFGRGPGTNTMLGSTIKAKKAGAVRSTAVDHTGGQGPR